jgi:hypothetical protein
MLLLWQTGKYYFLNEGGGGVIIFSPKITMSTVTQGRFSVEYGMYSKMGTKKETVNI